jgi:hypothetical protein
MKLHCLDGLSLIISTLLLSLACVASAADKDAEPGVPARKEEDKGKQGKAGAQGAEEKTDGDAKKRGAKLGGVLMVHVRWSPDPKKSEQKDAPGAMVYLKVQPDRLRPTDSQGFAKFSDVPIGDTKLVVLVGGPDNPCSLPVKITSEPKKIAVDVTPTGCVIGKQ